MAYSDGRDGLLADIHIVRRRGAVPLCACVCWLGSSAWGRRAAFAPQHPVNVPRFAPSCPTLPPQDIMRGISPKQEVPRDQWAIHLANKIKFHWRPLLSACSRGGSS